MAKQTFTTGQILTAAQMTSLQQTAMGGGSVTAKTASYTLVAADAGTVVQMNSASSTTITINTALFAAGDSVQIQNVGAGVCTVTAGTATVSTAGSLALSQYEGGQLYFNTTSAALFFDIVQSAGMTNPLTTTGDTIYSSSGTTPARLGIGSSGQVLTVAAGIPSWATASAGALTKISAASFSGVATTSTTFDGVFTATYNNYYIVFENMRSSVDNADFQFAFRLSGSTLTTGYYGKSSAIGQTILATTNGTRFSIGYLRSAAGSENSYTAQVYRNTYAMSFDFMGVTRFGDSPVFGGGFKDGLAASGADGFILQCDTGNITGKATIYGLAI